MQREHLPHFTLPEGRQVGPSFVEARLEELELHPERGARTVQSDLCRDRSVLLSARSTCPFAKTSKATLDSDVRLWNSGPPQQDGRRSDRAQTRLNGR